MVWFQCEDCGENLRKPKLPNHFRICSATKLSCIDCGTTFNQHDVQGHTQCISEMEKYGPKSQAQTPNKTGKKTTDEQKQDGSFDFTVGLSTRPPWFCSLCNTQVTSKQTLLLHAEGKKHKAKARAAQSAKQPPSEILSAPDKSHCLNGHPEKSNNSSDANGLNKNEGHLEDAVRLTSEANTECPAKKLERKLDNLENGAHNTKDSQVSDFITDEVMKQGTEVEEGTKKRKLVDVNVRDNQQDDKMNDSKNDSDVHIKWKKMIQTMLKQSPNGALKLKKLQKLVLKSLKQSGFANKNKDHLKELMLHKISSSSRFEIEGKLIRLVQRCS